MLQRTFELLSRYIAQKGGHDYAQMNQTFTEMLKDHSHELQLRWSDNLANPCIHLAQPALKRWIGRVLASGEEPLSALQVGIELCLAAMHAYKDRAFKSAEDEFGHHWLLAEDYRYAETSFLTSTCVYLDATLLADRYFVTIGEEERDIIHRYEVYDED